MTDWAEFEKMLPPNPAIAFAGNLETFDREADRGSRYVIRVRKDTIARGEFVSKPPPPGTYNRTRIVAYKGRDGNYLFETAASAEQRRNLAGLSPNIKKAKAIASRLERALTNARRNNLLAKASGTVKRGSAGDYKLDTPYRGATNKRAYAATQNSNGEAALLLANGNQWIAFGNEAAGDGVTRRDIERGGKRKPGQLTGRVAYLCLTLVGKRPTPPEGQQPNPDPEQWLWHWQVWVGGITENMILVREWRIYKAANDSQPRFWERATVPEAVLDFRSDAFYVSLRWTEQIATAPPGGQADTAPELYWGLFKGNPDTQVNEAGSPAQAIETVWLKRDNDFPTPKPSTLNLKCAGFGYWASAVTDLSPGSKVWEMRQGATKEVGVVAFTSSPMTSTSNPQTQTISRMPYGYETRSSNSGSTSGSNSSRTAPISVGWGVDPLTTGQENTAQSSFNSSETATFVIRYIPHPPSASMSVEEAYAFDVANGGNPISLTGSSTNALPNNYAILTDRYETNQASSSSSSSTKTTTIALLRVSEDGENALIEKYEESTGNQETQESSGSLTVAGASAYPTVPATQTETETNTRINSSTSTRTREFNDLQIYSRQVSSVATTVIVNNGTPQVTQSNSTTESFDYPDATNLPGILRDATDKSGDALEIPLTTTVTINPFAIVTAGHRGGTIVYPTLPDGPDVGTEPDPAPYTVQTGIHTIAGFEMRVTRHVFATDQWFYPGMFGWADEAARSPYFCDVYQNFNTLINSESLIGRSPANGHPLFWIFPEIRDQLDPPPLSEPWLTTEQRQAETQKAEENIEHQDRDCVVHFRTKSLTDKYKQGKIQVTALKAKQIKQLIDKHSDPDSGLKLAAYRVLNASFGADGES